MNQSHVLLSTGHVQTPRMWRSSRARALNYLGMHQAFPYLVRVGTSHGLPIMPLPRLLWTSNHAMSYLGIDQTMPCLGMKLATMPCLGWALTNNHAMSYNACPTWVGTRPCPACIWTCNHAMSHLGINQTISKVNLSLQPPCHVLPGLNHDVCFTG